MGRKSALVKATSILERFPIGTRVRHMHQSYTGTIRSIYCGFGGRWYVLVSTAVGVIKANPNDLARLDYAT